MTVAAERDTQRLIDQYGEEIVAIPGAACYTNALKAATVIVLDTPGEFLPRIWSVKTPLDEHAYLEHHGLIYNARITWPDNKYPNFSLDQLKANGIDATHHVLDGLLDDLSGKTNLGFKTILEWLALNRNLQKNSADSLARLLITIADLNSQGRSA